MTAKRVTVLGSTGSVGANTLSVIAEHPDRFRVVALAAGRNAAALVQQAQSFRPDFAAIADPAGYPTLKEGLAGTGIEVAAGPNAVVEAARRDAEWVMAAIAGAAGLESTLATVERGAIVALANKESLVCAGELMMAAARASGSMILPVDSEHNAIFQVFDDRCREAVRRLILTASGGPFRCASRDRMAAVRPAEALRHPNWDMGAKITIDSATMMNKGLELIEAHHLFAMPGEGHRHSRPSAIHRALHGRICGRIGAGAAGNARYAHAHRRRAGLAGAPGGYGRAPRSLGRGPPRFRTTRFPSGSRPLRWPERPWNAGAGNLPRSAQPTRWRLRLFCRSGSAFWKSPTLRGTRLPELGSGPLAGLDDVRSADREAREVAERFVERAAGVGPR